jgi:hypothetical protein
MPERLGFDDKLVIALLALMIAASVVLGAMTGWKEL